jgi:PAS domain S-box-containing protein
MNIDKKDNQFPWILIFIFLFLVVSFSVTAFRYYRFQQKRIVLEKQSELAAITDLKIWQITQWRNERLGDAEIISKNILAAHQIQSYFYAPNEPTRKKDILLWLRSFQNYIEYQSACLLDTGGIIRLSGSPLSDSLKPDVRTLVKEVVTQKREMLSDIQGSHDLSKLHLYLFAPLMITGQKDTTVVGILMLRIDPNKLLFPLIQMWPTPSNSSETLLIEQDNTEVVFLNELRHSKNTATILRLPISLDQLPAAMAVRGTEGIVEGIDYRGVPVLAALRQISNSPWFMVSKVDQEEVYAPLRIQAWTIIGVMILLILTSGAFLGLWWRNQRVLFYKRQYVAKVERLALLKHFEYLVKYANDVFVLANEDLNIVEVNDSALEVYGYTHDEMLALNIRDLHVIQPDELPEQLKYDIEHEGATFESVHRRKDGNTFPIEISVRRIEVDEKKYYQGIIRDITERKEAEEILKESEEKFRTFAEQSPNMIFINHNGRVVYANAQCEERIGYSKEEFYSPNFNFLQITAPEYVDLLKDKFSKHMRGEEVSAYEYSLLTKKGNRIDVIITTKLIPYENGKAILGIITDITERKQAEKEQQQSHSLLRATLESTADGILVVNNFGKFVNFNAQFAKMWDIPEKILAEGNDKDAIEFVLAQLKYPEDFISKVNYLYSHPDADSFDILEFKDGRTIERYSHPQRIEGQAVGRVWSFRDVTEQKKLQNQFLQSQKIQSIGTLAGGIAHDFNNILAIILGYSSTLEKNRNDAQRHAEGIAAIEQAIERGAALVRQILTFARKTDIAFESVTLPDLVHELFLMLKQTFPRTITFVQSYSPDLPNILADRTQIHQTLLNLCVNARDAMPNGGAITIRAKRCSKEEVSVRFPTADQELYVCVSVVDTGIGMDKETYTRVFDPFFTTKEKGKGTGLGLSVVYGVMQSHHGFVDVESRVGEGTTFYLFFPTHETLQSQVKDAQSEKAVPAGGAETVLLVEDEYLILKALRKHLKSYGYKIYVAADGEEALDVFTRHRDEIAVVLSDVGLPKISGTDVFKKLKDIDPNVKVILASGFFEPDLKFSLQQMGAQGFIQKPYSNDDVLRKIREVLDLKNP